MIYNWLLFVETNCELKVITVCVTLHNKRTCLNCINRISLSNSTRGLKTVPQQSFEEWKVAVVVFSEIFIRRRTLQRPRLNFCHYFHDKSRKRVLSSRAELNLINHQFLFELYRFLQSNPSLTFVVYQEVFFLPV